MLWVQDTKYLTMELSLLLKVKIEREPRSLETTPIESREPSQNNLFRDYYSMEAVE